MFLAENNAVTAFANQQDILFAFLFLSLLLSLYIAATFSYVDFDFGLYLLQFFLGFD